MRECDTKQKASDFRFFALLLPMSVKIIFFTYYIKMPTFKKYVIFLSKHVPALTIIF